MSDDLLLEHALVENIQRENLNPIEEARIIVKMKGTQEEIAAKIGKTQPFVAGRLLLLKYEDIAERVLRGELGVESALKLARDRENPKYNAVIKSFNIKPVNNLLKLLPKNKADLTKPQIDKLRRLRDEIDRLLN
jgi:ParB family chromosome partitioning protein